MSTNDVPTEDLLVGDEMGNIYYYVVEWPLAWEVERDTWAGTITLVARVTVHTQQICALVWSPNGEFFASGANDNICCLFEVNTLFKQEHRGRTSSSTIHRGRRSQSRSISAYDNHASEEVPAMTEDGTSIRTIKTSPDRVRHINTGAEKHRWMHGAAVKAIAFCPWQDGLIATGGGSNDKCIHFFHTRSGAALATISVSSQVTSLIWSTTRREIAATFGYAQPDHPYRIAVFSWPGCRQVGAIPWEGDHRALYAIPYPGGPSDVRDGTGGRTAKEGCIVVAASDESVKFHEVWSAEQRATVGGSGMLGGSDILEGLEGIDKEGDIIR